MDTYNLLLFLTCIYVSLVLRILRKLAFYAPHRQTHVRLRLTHTHKKESKPLRCPHQRQRSRIRFAPFRAEALQSQASGTSPVASSGSADSATGRHEELQDLQFHQIQFSNSDMLFIRTYYLLGSCRSRRGMVSIV